MNHLPIALELMAKGMGGIFAASFLLMILILILQKLTSKK
jgi:hypothetical protein